MKTQIVPHSETPATTRRRLSKKQRGVAIITVLAVIVLMSALVLSFFQMSQSEQVSSKINAEVLRSFSLRDTAINLAIGQIREATAPTDAQINGNALWTSQPGLIRTFQKDGNNGLNYKLYSAMNMVVDGNGEEETMLAEDQSPNWKQQPAVWVDLNQPVYRPKANQSGAALQGNVSQTGTAVYPIIDPSAFNPSRVVYSANANADLNPEGFSYEASNKVGGVSPDAQTLPMPVRWLYVLEDGTIGFLNVSGLFTSTAGGSTPTANNPIVGRIAFWADDESCKINVNTASEGVFWDTPRCDTPEERFLANCQPTAREFQRFPGHPAGVCLSSVLFPHKRYYATGPVDGNGTDIYQPPGVAAGTQLVDITYPPMRPEELQFLWDLAPMVSYRAANPANAGGSTTQLGAPAGTVGGIADTSKKMIMRSNMSTLTNLVDTTSAANPDDHLYTSTDEMLFRAKKANMGDSPDGARLTWANGSGGEVQPLSEDVLIQRLNRAKFLLTTKSSAPEVNVWGHPRICLWPLYETVPSLTSTATGAPLTGANYTAFDSIIGLTSQLSSTNYYTVGRKDAFSRHNEFYINAAGHNILLRDYLRLATGANIGGVTVGKLPGVAGKNTFLTKYNANTGDTKWSDMANLVVNMLDYIRMTNLADPALAGATRYGYSSGKYPGQITSYCGCGGGSYHSNNWAVAAEPDPKGVGRTFAPTRMHWVIMKGGEASANGATFVDGINPAANRYGTDYASAARCFNAPPTQPYVPSAAVYEMGIVVEGAAPAQGLSSIIPNMSVGIGGGNPGIGKKEPGDLVPGLCIESNSANATGLLYLEARTLTRRNQPAVAPFALAGSQGSSKFTETWPLNIPNYGGSQGMRAFSNGNVASNDALILFKPFAVPGSVNKVNFKASNSATQAGDYGNWKEQMWRLMVFDSTDVSVSNLVQAYYFNFGRPYSEVTFGLPTVSSNRTLNQLIAEVYSGASSWKALIDSRLLSIHTMVMPHGDYRTTTARRVLGNVPGNKYSIVKGGTGHQPEVGSLLKDYGVSRAIDTWNSFVPTPLFGNATQDAYLIYDPLKGMLDATKGISADKDRKRPHLAYTKADPNNLLSLNAVMDYPYEYKDYVHFFETVQRQRRGSMDPAITGDWQTGIANTPDGSYVDKADEGDIRPFFTLTGTAKGSSNDVPYFGAPGAPGLKQGEPNPNFTNITNGALAASPSRQVKGPVQFGSLASGSSTNALWQTLMFRPDPFGGNPAFNSPLSGSATVWDNRHYGSALNPENPKDHLLLDFFWMPVVEPYALSDTFSTKGKLNMNYKIFPFDYIHRSTHLHALFKAEKILAIPTDAGDVYKIETPVSASNDSTDPTRTDSTTSPAKPNSKRYWRKHIHAEKTLWQFERKFAKQGEFSNDKSRVFRTASEICDLWLIPESLGVTSSPGLTTKNENPYKIMRKFWIGIDVENSSAGTAGGTTALQKRQEITDKPEGHRLTGDNVKESPYANLYPRLTTKSNVFKVHFTVQTLQKARSTDVDRFIPNVDQVTSEYRGSAVVERTLDMTNPTLKVIDYLKDTSVFTDPKKRLDYYYSYRITELKQFTP